VLELCGIGKRLGAFRLQGLELQMQPGEYLVLMGPSGVGKTVLAEMVCGLLQPDAGQVRWRGTDITAWPPEARRFALSYQRGALFPHLTVGGNIAYGLRARGHGRAAARERAGAMAERLGVAALLHRRPTTLSVGEQQRVSLARALVTRPRLLVLDEPLSALDGGARLRLRHELGRIHRELGTPFLHITHDPREATELGDRVAVLVGERIRQIGPPDELLRQPADEQVAELLGVAEVPAADEP